MNAYTINQQLDSLYKDLEAAHNNDEEAVCLMFNADSKKEAIQLITDEIDSLEDALKGFETCEDDGMDYDALCRGTRYQPIRIIHDYATHDSPTDGLNGNR